MQANLKIPNKLVDVFTGEARYRGAYGGRGSGKTRTFAMMTAVWGYKLAEQGISGQILAGREFMNSLSDSSFEEIKGAIESEPFLKAYYDIGENYIRTKNRRVYYTFAGLRRNLDSIKSKARILLAWIDEAETVSETAWMKLLPTVREDNSEIWITWNPESKESATHKRFREDPPDNAKIVEMNWRDNPWFPKVLDQERVYDQKSRPDTYEHIWEGDFLIHVDGAYYAREIKAIKDQIIRVPYDYNASVITAWDLGLDDATAIWFAQYVGKEIHIIDYYEASGNALDHYVSILREKGYNYEQHILPHDVKVKELGTGKSRLEVLSNMGLNNIKVCPMLGIEDGIQQVRAMLNRCWFDKDNTERGLECLRQYRREWDDNLKSWRGRPLHDWTSHGADAFRYLAVGYQPTSGWGKPIRRGLKGIA
jgi:phage terminase large subunit